MRVSDLEDFLAGPTVLLVDDEEAAAGKLGEYLALYREDRATALASPRTPHRLDTKTTKIRRESDPTIFDTVPIRLLYAPDRAAFLETMNRESADIVFVDLHLDGSRLAVKGLALISEIYDRWPCDIIAYTSEAESSFGTACYERGADDFIQKGTGSREIRNRVVKQWRQICEQRSGLRRKPLAPKTVQLGRWGFARHDRHMRSEDGRTVRLSIAEYRFLSFFANDPTSLMDAEAFELFISPPDQTPTENKMHSFKNRLLKKLGSDFPLVSVPGHGYRLRQTPD